MEHEIRENLPHCDLVFYPLSPSIALPTNTSLLPPEEETIEYPDEESVIEATQGHSPLDASLSSLDLSLSLSS
jgi:hypothetical protein